MNVTSTPIEALSKSRGWIITAGVLSLIVGFLAVGSPFLFSSIVVQVLGAFILASGLISLVLSIVGRHVAHRVMTIFTALLRIAAGAALLFYFQAGVSVITLILALFLILEGIVCVGGAVKMRNHSGWIWILLNGITALILGAMIYVHWPSDSTWVIGLLYGINAIFGGFSLLMLGLSTPKHA